jgi:hypothetical protein
MILWEMQCREKETAFINLYMKEKFYDNNQRIRRRRSLLTSGPPFLKFCCNSINSIVMFPATVELLSSWLPIFNHICKRSCYLCFSSNGKKDSPLLRIELFLSCGHRSLRGSMRMRGLHSTKKNPIAQFRNYDTGLVSIAADWRTSIRTRLQSKKCFRKRNRTKS